MVATIYMLRPDTAALGWLTVLLVSLAVGATLIQSVLWLVAQWRQQRRWRQEDAAERARLDWHTSHSHGGWR